MRHTVSSATVNNTIEPSHSSAAHPAWLSGANASICTGAGALRATALMGGGTTIVRNGVRSTDGPSSTPTCLMSRRPKRRKQEEIMRQNVYHAGIALLVSTTAVHITCKLHAINMATGGGKVQTQRHLGIEMHRRQHTRGGTWQVSKRKRLLMVPVEFQ